MSSTHSANPIGCAAGLAVLNELDDRELVDAAASKGAIFMARLKDIAMMNSGDNLQIDASGKGLIGSLIFSKDGVADRAFASAVADECIAGGLLVVKTGRESIKFGPPLTIDVEALVEGLDVLEAAIKSQCEAFKCN